MAVEAVRVVQDPAYAARLSDAEWQELALDPTWNEMVGEQAETIAPIIAQYGHKLPGGGREPSTPTEVPVNRPFRVIGTDVARIQGYGIVTNQGSYTENLRMPGMLFMRTLRSRYPHAKIKSVDIAEAEKIPGVVKILHRGNLPEVYKDVFLGSAQPTRFLFAEEVFEVGAPIAIVAAQSEHIGDEALRAIKVEYEILPAVIDMLEGMQASTPKQFQSNLSGTTIAVTNPLVRGNIATATSDASVEVVARKSFEQHVALELTNSLSYWDGDKLNVTYTCQHAHGTRSGLASALKIPQNKVRVFQTGYMGSGYGYRSGIDLSEVHAAILSKVTGRPIKNNYTRYEDFVTRTHRPEFRNEVKMGVNRDGKIQSLHAKVIANVGAQRASAANGAWIQFQDLYTIPNVRLEATDVMTNTFKSGPYRCVSHPNGTFAMETTMDKAAYAIGMDPIAFRLNNLNETGNPDTRRPFNNIGTRDCIVGVRDTIDWAKNWHAPKAKQVRPGVYHGIGMAVHLCSHGAGSNPSTGQIMISNDGSVTAISGNTDIGSGQRTHMLQIAAEALGVKLDQITITPGIDTDVTTDTGGTNGSRMTNTGGRGMYEAAIDARRQVLDWASRKFNADAAAATPPLADRVTAADLDLIGGEVIVTANARRKMTLRDVVTYKATAIVGVANYLQPTNIEQVGVAAHAAEVEVDTATGSVKVTRYVAAHDVGKAINPFSVRQQIEGGVVMALGAVFTEELLVDKATGLPINPNLLDYRPLSIKDVPHPEIVIVEKPKSYGTFGAHGLGEPPMGPPAPAISNAIYNAIGVWLTDMPITREKIIAALKGV